jgi:hypothetical protein
MAQPRPLHCYDYVNRPYVTVREVLGRAPNDVLRRATTSAAARSSQVGATLHAAFAGVDVGIDIRVEVQSVRDEEGIAGLPPLSRMTLAWKAARGAALFPVMSAELSFWPLTSSETQIELEGAYRTPLGPVGNAVDAALGHRLAEAAVHRFLREVAYQVELETRATVGEERVALADAG